MMLTFRMISVIIKAYRSEQDEKHKLDMERTRLIAYYSANDATIKKAGSMQNLIPFPWDDAPTGEISKQDIKEFFKKVDEKIKNG